MMQLIDACTTMSVDEILATPDVAERVELYRAHAERAKAQIVRCATVHGKLVVLDLRDEPVIHPTNRGGRHDAAGTCQVDNQRAETVLAELVGRIGAES